MFKRLELHNHTTESDSSLTPMDLIEYMHQNHVDAFAITDHNTISGHKKIQDLLTKTNLPISCIYGMEYTTYYGHILCFNLKEYVSWENINLHKPELLFQAAREKGALTGVAHPFSYGNPFARGCRFDMEITDYTSFDFIEIFNDLEPLHEVNERGLLWWEDLVLQGYPLAFTSGMDLHGKWDMDNQFATYIEGSPDGNIEKELEHAIKQQRTWISKGPLVKYEIQAEKGSLTFTIAETGKPGFLHKDTDKYYLTLRTKKRTLTKEITKDTPLTIPFTELEQETVLIPKLYHRDTTIENLVAVAPVIHLS
ncbi:CehA/McbA family metallohydrolase [Anaerocolumna sp. AGMB13025]|uniref:CehA/McbA family metallohydrolase n=1 Tax=Anaerocolumna sp. AGMB13025 TaxID=3039116 RepID=UPI00241FF7AF|nr:CehA/McbA family metallohydrolase [Anaerocolumna sp. AGMB13025]WFR58758.1 CehA/McbA family metallohydrolase [Anaerocolumna sp. AGMB13025]